MFEGLGDLLRLLAVPLFGWAALRDVRTRRVPNRVWYVLGGLGIVLLAVDLLRWYPFTGRFGTLRLVQVGVSVLFVAPLGYGFWRIGGFGGADAKALMALAVLFPTYPTYFLPESLVALGLPSVLPVQPTAVGVFSLSILTDTVLVGMAFPLVLAARNVAAGRIGNAMFFGRVVPVVELPAVHGRLFETREGFSRSGLDLDALRMYLRWRGCSLAELRLNSTRYRNPESVCETYPPTDGAVDAGGVAGDDEGPLQSDGGEDEHPTPIEDPWAAERFLEEIQYSAYGTDTDTLREGLETVVEREEVWISPGLPFIVPMFVGLVVAVTYGDLLYGLLVAVGMV
ncbi:MAG: prepilin peptidase [Halolamina sp.]|uniref:A24 family peptidase n=1 Tax=Halolamina sp. TaxID=1940283 RepID=UPI002FC32DCF